MASPQLVTSATQVVFMIGSPIRQARSPFLFNNHFRRLGLDIVMTPLDVSPVALEGFVATIRGASNCPGFVATLPHKTPLEKLVDERTPRAAELGSVNVVRRKDDGCLVGDMVDGPGFWNGVARAGFEPRDRNMVLAGGGAAGTAIAHEFAARGGRRIALICRSDSEFDRLRDLLSTMPVEFTRTMPKDLAEWDIAVNATPVGMAHAPGTLFDRRLLASMRKGSFVADAITDPIQTRLLTDATELGLHVIAGHAMTEGQFDLLVRFLGVARDSQTAQE